MKGFSLNLLLGSFLLVPSLFAQPLERTPATLSSLAEKWQWAGEQLQASDDNQAWLSYRFTTRLDARLDPEVGSRLYRVQHWRNFSPALYQRVSDDQAWRNGLTLDSLLSGNTTTQSASMREVTLLVRARLQGQRLMEVHVVEATTPLDWLHLPIYWLGDFSSDDSLRLLSSQLNPQLDKSLRHTLIRSLGMHATDDRAGLLMSLFDTATWRQDRPVILDSLARQLNTDVEAVLSAIATDTNAPVSERRIALSALGRSADAGATLQQVAGPTNSTALRVQAISSLARFPDPAVTRLLTELVESDASVRVRRTALQALTMHPDQTRWLQRVAREHEFISVRREAIEALGLFTSSAVRGQLNALAWSESDPSLRAEAVLSLSRHATFPARQLLLELARNHPNAHTREEAQDALQEDLF